MITRGPGSSTIIAFAVIVMTDARFPERWLNDLRFQEITGEDFRAYSFALMWSVANRTDGIISPHRLRFIPGMTMDTPDRLIAAGLWVALSDGNWLIDSFTVTQTTRRELDALDRTRAKEAENKRLKRLQERQNAADNNETAGHAGVPPDVRPPDPPKVPLDVESPSEPLREIAGQRGVRPDVRGDVRTDTPRTEIETAPGQEVPPTNSKTCGQCGKDSAVSLVPHQGVLVCRQCRFAGAA